MHPTHYEPSCTLHFVIRVTISVPLFYSLLEISIRVHITLLDQGLWITSCTLFKLTLVTFSDTNHNFYTIILFLALNLYSDTNHTLELCTLNLIQISFVNRVQVTLYIAFCDHNFCTIVWLVVQNLRSDLNLYRSTICYGMTQRKRSRKRKIAALKGQPNESCLDVLSSMGLRSRGGRAKTTVVQVFGRTRCTRNPFLSPWSEHEHRECVVLLCSYVDIYSRLDDPRTPATRLIDLESGWDSQSHWRLTKINCSIALIDVAAVSIDYGILQLLG